MSTNVNRYFVHGRLCFTFPIQVGNAVLNWSDLSVKKTTITKITTVSSGEKVPGHGGPYIYKKGFAYVLHLSTGKKVIYSGDEVQL